MMHHAESKPRSSRRLELWGLAFALCFPSALTWCYFVALADAPTAIQQGTYALGKVIQFSFPLLFVFVLAREPILFRWRWRQGLPEGIASGLVILASIVGLWQLLERAGSPFLAELVPNLSAKILGLGVEAPSRYFALALFYAVIHTLLEEYYWRWFVFAHLRRLFDRKTAIGVSSLGFMAHHVILLGFYAGWDSPYTYLLSLGVAVGGAYWAWLYERSETLVAPWVSHIFVDVGIFAVGYALLL